MVEKMGISGNSGDTGVRKSLKTEVFRDSQIIKNHTNGIKSALTNAKI
jgi:hypothetical protein